MKTFYQFMMSYRGKTTPDDYSRLADWMFANHDFPKQAVDYDKISTYLETLSPFPNALTIFDELWDIYKQSQ